MVVSPAGALVATGIRDEPYRLVGPEGSVVEPAAAFFRDLQAAGRSELTIRSYGMDLLRWFRFLWAVGVPWDRATRAEARDFIRWLQVAGKPARPHWRGAWGEQRLPSGPAAAGRPPKPGTGRRPAGPGYAPFDRGALRDGAAEFYEFHPRAGTGPMVNPFPLAAGRGGGGRTRTAIRWSRSAAGARGLVPAAGAVRGSRAASPTRSSTRCSRALPSHRDRALVAFYVSTGARASELLSAHRRADVDPGRQLITVVRKGTRDAAGAAGVGGRVRVAAALPGEMAGLVPRGRGAAAVVDAAPAVSGR